MKKLSKNKGASEFSVQAFAMCNCRCQCWCLCDCTPLPHHRDATGVHLMSCDEDRTRESVRIHNQVN